MEIAPGVEARIWKSLNLNDPASPDWATAIQILDSRIRERFLDPVDQLILMEEGLPATRRRFGFAVLAIDCLLVETLGAFVNGYTDTVGKSKATFCEFLMGRSSFKSEFTGDRAKRFYDNFRCGILHQAETKGDSRVWSCGPLLQDDGARIIVNRNLFHSLLKDEFQVYLGELKDPPNATLRVNFRQKMDFIAKA